MPRKAVYQSDPAKYIARSRRYGKRNRASVLHWKRVSSLRRKYGITIEQKEAMEIAQDHRCAICRRKRKLVIDHCHISGRIRGLLCDICNLGLGRFNDQAELLRAAIRYLKSSSISSSGQLRKRLK